jgi:hypothetical protein
VSRFLAGSRLRRAAPWLPSALLASAAVIAQLTLPYAGSVGTAGDAFRVTNTNTATGKGLVGNSAGDYGILGKQTRYGNYGYLGSKGYGAYGRHQPTGNFGILGSAAYGVWGQTPLDDGFGVYGKSSSGPYGYLGGQLYGVFGYSNHGAGAGVYGSSEAAGGSAVAGQSVGAAGIGVEGIGPGRGVLGSSYSGHGVWGSTNSGVGTVGESVTNYGVEGTSEKQVGVAGFSVDAAGITGHSESGNAVEGQTNNPAAYAGYFQGILTATDKRFRIDDPLDPANKTLNHACVESSVRLNVYDGVAMLGPDGAAWVRLPEWFQALNRGYRYQLTCVGAFAPVFVASKVSGNRFRIAGGQPGMEVCWQVTGTRQDAFARAHPMLVEQEKTPAERGLYLHPLEHGMPASAGIGYVARRSAGATLRETTPPPTQ